MILNPSVYQVVKSANKQPRREPPAAAIVWDNGQISAGGSVDILCEAPRGSQVNGHPTNTASSNYSERSPRP